MAKKTRGGAFVQQPGGFRAFIPSALPPNPSLMLDESLQSKLGRAWGQVGRLDSVSTLVPDPERFVSMYVRQEAVLSSQIEGTQASLAELLDFEAEQNEGRDVGDVGDVVNCVAALSRGLELLKTLPVCTRLLCDVHRVLLSGTRGGEAARTPGELRRSQNWIGGSSPATATFVPPPPAEMRTAMGELEKYLNMEKPTPLLIEIGLAHAQFETIHPFLDGNGRLGRLLITFLLSARGELSRPLLYLSHYFKQHRTEYYDRLQAVRTQGDWEGWIGFFLDGVATVAGEATERARRIIALRHKDEALVREKLGRRAGGALDALELLIERPVVTAHILCLRLKRSQPTVDRLLADLVQVGVLRETTGKRWGRRFRYHRYLALFDA